jgi:hypothetical protein
MAFMNLNFQLLVYKDQPSGSKPNIRIPDLTESFQGLVLNNVKTDDPTIQPGETKTIAVTTRTLGLSNTTQFAIERPDAASDKTRLRWTGTGSNPLFRTARNLSIDATTQVSITRQAPRIARVQSTGGTPIVASPVQLGDILQFGPNTDTFTSPFGDQNVGKQFVVQAVGSNYVDVIDEGTIGLDSNVTLGADYAKALRVYSPGPVRIGDSVRIDGFTLNTNNVGDFVLTDATPDYVEFINPYSSPQTFTNSDDLIRVYDHLIGFVYIRSSGPVRLTTNRDSVEDLGSLALGGPALKLSTTKAWQIDATNLSNDPITVLITHAGTTENG